MGQRLQRSTRYLWTIILLLWASSASAQLGPEPAPPSQPASGSQNTAERHLTPAPDQIRHGFLRTFGRDEWRIWSSPFRSQSYSSHTVKKYVIPFALISGALIATDRRAADVLPNTRDQAKWSGRVSQIGAAYTLAGISGATYLVGHFTEDDHAREAGWLGLEAIAHSQVAVFTLKQITNRQRPVTHEGRGGFWQGGDSFPSGHATTSFAVATVFAYEYRDHIAVPITAYTLASLVAASRLSARRHWVSDIFVGGSMGFLIGRYVYKRHHNPNLPGSPVTRASRVIPEFGFGNGGLALDWRW